MCNVRGNLTERHTGRHLSEHVKRLRVIRTMHQVLHEAGNIAKA